MPKTFGGTPKWLLQCNWKGETDLKNGLVIKRQLGKEGKKKKKKKKT